MASKIPQKVEELGTEGPETSTDRPLLDLSDAAVKALIRSASRSHRPVRPVESQCESSFAGVAYRYSRSETGRGRAGRAASSGSPGDNPGLHREQTLALQLFAG